VFYTNYKHLAIQHIFPFWYYSALNLFRIAGLISADIYGEGIGKQLLLFQPNEIIAA
jgi:hypothetical protein